VKEGQLYRVFSTLLFFSSLIGEENLFMKQAEVGQIKARKNP
jgi:hypothetical protein